MVGNDLNGDGVTVKRSNVVLLNLLLEHEFPDHKLPFRILVNCLVVDSFLDGLELGVISHKTMEASLGRTATVCL